jgi:adenylate cyclase
MVTASDILDASILIADDKPANVSLLEQLLRGAGYTSIASTMDSHKVHELQRRHGYSLIVLDLQMPGMDGFQVMDALKEDLQEDDYLPVLVITAQPRHKLRALQAGAKDFIGKPFELAEVLVRVRNMLEVRLLHVESRNHTAVLEQTLREVEASREVIRRQGAEVRSLYDQVVIEQKLADRLLLNVLPDAITVRPDEDIRHLVPAFLAQRRRDVEALRTALTGLEFTTIRELGHAIKETGRGYGFDGLTEIGSALERAAHHEDAAAIYTRIDHLSGYLGRVHVVD